MARVDDVLVRAEDIVSCDLGSGSALLNLQTSNYFRLNDTAHFIWEQLESGGKSAQQLAEQIEETYEVSKAECLPDVIALLAEMQSANLLNVKK